MLRRRKRRAQSKAIAEGTSATRWLVSGVYPRRRPWEAFAVGRLDFLEAFVAFDLLDLFNVVDALDPLDLFAAFDFLDEFKTVDLFELVDLLVAFDPFDPAGSERLSDRGSRA
jgi:hypothetical protein